MKCHSYEVTVSSNDQGHKVWEPPPATPPPPQCHYQGLEPSSLLKSAVSQPTEVRSAHPGSPVEHDKAIC